MARILLRVVVIALALLIGMAGGAWLFRDSLAERALHAVLAEHGYSDARLEVTALSFHRIRIEDFALQDDSNGATAARIDVLYPLFDVLRGDWHQVEIKIQEPAAEVAHERLTRILGETDTDNPANGTGRGLLGLLSGLARVDLQDGRVELGFLPQRPLLLEFSGTLEGGADGLRQAAFEGQVDDREHDLGLTFEAQYADRQIDAQVNVIPLDNGLGGRLEFTVDPHSATPTATANLHGWLDAGEGSAPTWWRLPWPDDGRLEWDIQGSGELATLAPPTSVASAVDRFVSGGWEGQWRAQAEGVHHGLVGGPGRLSADGSLAVEAGGIAVTASGDGAAKLEAMNSRLGLQLPVPSGIGRALTAGPLHASWSSGNIARITAQPGLTVSLTPQIAFTWPERSASLTISGVGEWQRQQGLDRLYLNAELADMASDLVAIRRLAVVGDWLADEPKLQVAAELDRVTLDPISSTLEGLQARGVSLDAALTPTGPDEVPGLEVVAGGRLGVAELAWADQIVSADGVTGTFRGGHIEAGDDPQWMLDLALDPAAWRLSRPRGDPARITTSAHRARLEGPNPLSPIARATHQDMAVDLESPAVNAAGVDVDIRPGRIEEWLGFRVERLTLAGGPVRLAPMRLRGQIDDWSSDQGHRLHGEGQVNGTDIDVTFEGIFPQGSERPRLRVSWPDLTFSPDGVQPEDVVPALSPLQRVAGEVDARLEVWNLMDPEGQSWVSTDDLDFSVSDARIEGLDGRVAMASLRPWRSDGLQRLRANRLDMGLTVTEPNLRFAITARPGRGSVVEIEQGRGRFAGGQLSMPAWTWDPQAPGHDFDLEASNLDLDRVIDQLGFPGLGARGTISGRLPITLIDQRILLNDGRLRSRGGRINYDAGASTTAIEDPAGTLAPFDGFAYDSLRLDLDQELDRPGRIDIMAQRTSGSGDDEETITHTARLQGELEPIIEVILAGDPLTPERLGRHLEAVGR